ncbi:MAG: choice-of-anchor Q domain-containing protein [Bacteroidia bacterium]|nr:choice-of-anchor Q domain-containing protein [Bacteroidia bacterium]
MKLKLTLFFATISLLVWASCEQAINPIPEGVLTFDQDTVKFDSIFTTLLTPSERLIVSNREDNDIAVDRVWLENGDESEFMMIVDGIQANDVSDLAIAQDDSMHIFVNLKSKERDGYAEEYINFQVGDDIQRVLVQAWIVDAYFLTARLQQEDDFLNLDPGSFFFRQDTILTPDKPIIMDGPIFIPEGVTVRVEPGTEIFYTPYRFGVKDSNGLPTFGFYSWLIVGGTLIADGTAEQPITFTSSRLQDTLFKENPAQWRGIRFLPSSTDNLLRHTRIKNALIGVEVDSISLNLFPKVTIQNTHIRNMGVHGVVGVGVAPNGAIANGPPSILMENSIVSSCKLHTVYILGGGKYNFYNSTFANYSIRRFSRRTPQVRISNWFSFDGVSAVQIESFTQFTNCIVWGSEEDEVVLDTLQGAPYDLLNFDHSIVRVGEEFQPFMDPHLTNSLNLDPLFADFFTRNYRLQEGSPAIDAGINFPIGSTGYDDDFRGKMDSLRTGSFDIGAYEFIP